jgi:chromosome segregation ATPase
MTLQGRARALSPLVLCVSLLIAQAGEPAVAQAARTGSGANAQLTQQLQQLASERTTLQAENARMKKELAELTKERDALSRERAASERRSLASESSVARAAQEKSNSDAELQRQKERTQELVEKFREMAQTLREVETERSTFKQSLTARDAELTACIDKNTALYKLNGEVLAQLEGTGPVSRFASIEPFTQLKRVQLENLVDDYRYRADDQRISASPAEKNATP